MRKNITITWANEKGGVGKTTLCTLFANYLSEKHQGEVCVLDCDRQHSIVDKRKFDSQSLQTDKVPYEVEESLRGHAHPLSRPCDSDGWMLL